jgi:hypothetical protein
MSEQSTELIFEISHPGRRCHRLPAADVPVAEAEKLLPSAALAESGGRQRRLPRHVVVDRGSRQRHEHLVGVSRDQGLEPQRV